MSEPTTVAGFALLELLAPVREQPDCRHDRTWFDRTFCACGSMHDVCEDCSWAIRCPLNTPEARAAHRQSWADQIIAVEHEAIAATPDPS